MVNSMDMTWSGFSHLQNKTSKESLLLLRLNYLLHGQVLIPTVNLLMIDEYHRRSFIHILTMTLWFCDNWRSDRFSVRCLDDGDGPSHWRGWRGRKHAGCCIELRDLRWTLASIPRTRLKVYNIKQGYCNTNSSWTGLFLKWKRETFGVLKIHRSKYNHVYLLS